LESQVNFVLFENAELLNATNQTTVILEMVTNIAASQTAAGTILHNPSQTTVLDDYYAGISFAVSLPNQNAQIDGILEFVMDVSTVKFPSGATLSVKTYQGGTWVLSNTDCSEDYPEIIQGLSLVFTLCSFGQYALFYNFAGSAAQTYPLENSVIQTLSTILTALNSTSANSSTLEEISNSFLSSASSLSSLLTVQTYVDGPPIVLTSPTLTIQCQQLSPSTISSTNTSLDNGQVVLPNLSSALPSLASYGASMITYSINPYLYTNSADKITGGVIDFSLTNPNGGSDLSFTIPTGQPGIGIVFPPVSYNNTVVTEHNATTISNGTLTPVCKYWDSTLDEWSTNGVTTVINADNSITCVTQHLTSFSVHLDFTINSVPVPTLKQIVLIFIFMAIVIACFAFLFGIAYYYDQRATENHSVHLTYGGSYWQRFKELFNQSMREKHLYASLVTAINDKRKFTRVQRMAALVSTLLLSTGINSLFEEADGAGSANTNALTVSINGRTLHFPVSGFYTSFLVFPCSLLMLFSFNFAAGPEQMIIKVRRSTRKPAEKGEEDAYQMQEINRLSIANEKALQILSKKDQQRISKLVQSTTQQRRRSKLVSLGGEGARHSEKDIEMTAQQEKEELKSQEGNTEKSEGNAEKDVEMTALQEKEQLKSQEGNAEKSEGEEKVKRKSTTSPKKAKSFLVAIPSMIPTDTLIEDDDLEVVVIPAYHEEDLVAKERIRFKFLYSSKGWLYFAYFQSVCFSIIGVVLPFFYAGNMSTNNQIYWMIDVIVSLILGALIYQPLQNALLSVWKALFNKVPEKSPKNEEEAAELDFSL